MNDECINMTMNLRKKSIEKISEKICQLVEMKIVDKNMKKNRSASSVFILSLYAQIRMMK